MKMKAQGHKLDEIAEMVRAQWPAAGTQAAREGHLLALGASQQPVTVLASVVSRERRPPRESQDLALSPWQTHRQWSHASVSQEIPTFECRAQESHPASQSSTFAISSSEYDPTRYPELPSWPSRLLKKL
jgi:hypothetical protein